MTSLRNMSFGDALDAHGVLDAFDDAEARATHIAREAAAKR
jgi:hypothetical protein